ncbi:LPP20 family lipoprotein [Helicobacter canis]|uniref:Lipoprotein LPP20-like domain-containing protein n=1 Tax=Helicobacter canis TaxID=29419 RepID=A0A5M9QLL1_9HELI|nr:LPP20 family lipoprotein [Helicobacter canis]KAA8709613.1 hypothetical protein F4V45_04910 [Helicobacter canis]
MSKLFSHLVVLIALALLVGCASKPPSWFLSTKQGAKFYGVGSGGSFESAKQAAIDDLAQSVQTQVRSSTHIHNTQHNDKLTTKLSQHIELDSSALSLPNLQVSNKAYKQGTYYVQVGISKEQLLAPLKQDLQAILSRAKPIIATAPSCITLRDFGALESSLKQASKLAQILDALQAPLPKDFHKLSSLYDQVQKPLLTTTYQGLTKAQEALFSAEISKLATSTKDSSTPHLAITAKKRGPTTISLEVTLKDCAQRVIFQASIQESQASYDYALKRAAIVLYKKLYAFMQGEDGFPKI